jgi:competence protein ComEA
MKQAGYILVGVLVGFQLAGVLMLITRLPAGTAVKLEPPPTRVPITVQVMGAVLRPGVYLFPEGSRVQDALAAAGGVSSEADLTSINLAEKLQDGQQLNIPGSGGAIRTESPGTGFRVLPSEDTPEPSEDLIDINLAEVDELETLPGIGPTTAQRIVDYRDEHGPFTQIEDLMNVPGIGPATFDNIKDLITV